MRKTVKRFFGTPILHACYTGSMDPQDSELRLFELVYLSIHDVGRSVNLNELRRAISHAAALDSKLGKTPAFRRDTPTSLSLPRPLRFPLDKAKADGLGKLLGEAKVYDDGAITVTIRARERLHLADLGRLTRENIVVDQEKRYSLEDWAKELFRRVLEMVAPAVIDPVPEERRDCESNLAFCLLECPEGPEAYLASHRETAAALLVGADEGAYLHESQISAALGRPFSYSTGDLAVFDMDRCLIIDPNGDYEDILLIVEHANYRLLELRALDRLLDFRLEEAEKDLTDYGRLIGKKRLKRKFHRNRFISNVPVPMHEPVKQGKPGQKKRVTAPMAKFARIQSLRFEALFILENLENSSKIIGDYYLGQIYDRLCAIFNTDGWSRSVERRLDVLSSVYDMAKTDAAERKMLMLEIVFIVVCVVFPALQIWQALVLR